MIRLTPKTDCSENRIWYARNIEKSALPGSFQSIYFAGKTVLKVLFDHSVLQDATIAEQGYILAEAEVMGNKIKCLSPSRVDRPRRSDWKQQEIDVLPRITHHIHEGHIIAFSSSELELEGFRIEQICGPSTINIFQGCEFRTISTPLERSKWGLTGDQIMNKQAIIDFCKCFFLSPDQSRTDRFIENMRQNPRYHLTEFEEKCLQRAYIFKKLCYGVSENHYPDMLHLWTAEENSLDAFLTHDKKFKNVVERQKVKFHCRVMFPTHLLNELQSVV